MNIRAATFCDIDETLYRGVMLRDAARWLDRNGVLPRGYYLKVVWQLLLRKLRLLDHEKAFQQGVHFLAGRKVVDVEAMMQQIYDDVLKPQFIPGLQELVSAWQAKGPVVVATESLALLAQPFATDFGFDGVVGTKLAVKDGVLTGELDGHVLKGDAKLAAVQQWATVNSIVLEHSTGVGGRVQDIPLLELMGFAVVINPDADTSRAAHAAGWTVLTP